MGVCAPLCLALQVQRALEGSFQVCFPGEQPAGSSMCKGPAHREQAGVCLQQWRGQICFDPSHFHLAPPVPHVLCLPNKWGKLPGGEDTPFQTSPAAEQLPAWLFCNMICVSSDENCVCVVLGALGAACPCGTNRLRGGSGGAGAALGSGQSSHSSKRHKTLTFSKPNTPGSGGGSAPHHSLCPLRAMKCLFLSHSFSFNKEGWKSDQ